VLLRCALALTLGSGAAGAIDRGVGGEGRETGSSDCALTPREDERTGAVPFLTAGFMLVEVAGGPRLFAAIFVALRFCGAFADFDAVLLLRPVFAILLDLSAPAAARPGIGFLLLVLRATLALVVFFLTDE
jgi:hypothetical protein